MGQTASKPRGWSWQPSPTWASSRFAPDAASTLAVAAFVVLALRHDRDAWATPSPRIDLLTLTAAIFVAAALVSTLLNPIGLGGLWALGKFALVPLSIWALRVTRRYELGPALWLGATAGAVAAGTVALLQVTFTDVWRPAALTNPILFGDLALTLGLVAVATRPLADRIASRHRTIASIAAVSLAVVASVLTQSRGSWIAGPALLVVLALQHRHSLSPRSAVAFGLVVVMAITFAAVSHNGAPVRYFEHGVGDTMAYIVGPRDLEVRSTSIGARFEMWRSAAAGFRSEPIFGIGWGNLRGRFNADVDAGVRVPRIAQYNHAHNQFISSTASGGLVGLATLLALLGVPGLIFVRALLDRDLQVERAGCGRAHRGGRIRSLRTHRGDPRDGLARRVLRLHRGPPGRPARPGRHRPGRARSQRSSAPHQPTAAGSPVRRLQLSNPALVRHRRRRRPASRRCRSVVVPAAAGAR